MKIGNLFLLSIIFFAFNFSSSYAGDVFPKSNLEAGDGIEDLILKDTSGKKIEITNFKDVIKKYTHSDAEIVSVESYLVDLNRDGMNEIISLVSYKKNKNLVMIFDLKGVCLAAKNAESADELYLNPYLNGYPVFFGYKTLCALSAGVCNWEFNIWNGKEISRVLTTISWTGKSGPGHDPHIKYSAKNKSLKMISDNGEVLWDEKSNSFVGLRETIKK